VRGLLAAAVLALATAGCGGGSDSFLVPPAAVTLQDVQAQVFTPRCAVTGCHIGPSAPFNLDLGSVSSSAANLVGVPSAEIPSILRVAAHDPAGSYLYMKITGDPGIQGDQMPRIGGPLGDGDIQLIASWIDGGAK